VRVLLSDSLKTLIRSDSRGQGALAARVGLNCTQLSWFMHDRVSIGPVNRTKVARLGALLGLPESACFRELRRG
jgi:hypothetical protein